jgi:hypothetical protein
MEAASDPESSPGLIQGDSNDFNGPLQPDLTRASRPGLRQEQNTTHPQTGLERLIGEAEESVAADIFCFSFRGQ